MNSQTLIPKLPSAPSPPVATASVSAPTPKRKTGLRAAQFLEPMSPQGLLLAFKRRWRVAVVLGVPIAVVAAAFAYLATPAPFTASALLRLAAVEQRLVFQTAEAQADFQTYRRTQMALIKSRFVMNAALRKPNVAALSLVKQQTYPVAWLEEAIQVDAYDSPEILRISLTGDRPAELAEIVNAVKDAYLEEVVNAERKQRIARLNDLERIFEQTEEKVRRKEERVNNLAQELGSGDSKTLTIKQQMAMEYFAQLRREHARVRFELMRLQVGDEAVLDPATSESEPQTGSIAAVKPPKSPAAAADAEDEFEAAPSVAPNASTSATPNTVAGDPRVVSAERRAKQLRDLIAKHERQVINKNHPTLLMYRQELAELENAAKKSDDDDAAAPGQPKRRSRLELLTRQEQLLREELDKYSELVKNIGTSSFELEAMKAEMDQVAKVSDKVGAEMEALRIELQSPTRITQLQEAEVPQTRSLKKKHSLTSAAGIGGLGLVFLIVSVLEFHTRRICSPKDATETLGLEMIGTLPAMPRPLLRIGNPGMSRLVLWNNALIESVDSIRSILLHAPETEQRKVVMIASATAGEGKTTFACQLASSLARSGRNTLLIDADLRRPRAHQLLNVDNRLGLSELLTDSDLSPETVMQQGDDPHLFVIPAGQVTEDALQQIARDGAAGVFAAMRREFDFIIVDSSPLLCVADSTSIARNVDGAILVIRQDVSRVPVVAVACERMDLLGLPLLGTVMVGVQSNLSGYGYSYDYHYATSGASA